MKKKRAKEVYTLTDLRKWDKIDPPVRLGVFGDPVAHSLSSVFPQRVPRDGAP